MLTAMVTEMETLKSSRQTTRIWDEYVKGPDELVMLLRVNVSDQMEVLLLGSLGANVPVRDDDSRPARDKAKETFARKAARKALGRQEKERRSKSRRLN